MIKDARIRINFLSLLICFAFIGSLLSLHYHAMSGFWESIKIGLPVFVIFIIWTQKRFNLVLLGDRNLDKKQVRSRDIFLITYGFYFGSLVYIILEFSNTDLKAWWPLFMCQTVLVGFVFSIFFSSIAALSVNHRIYTIVLSSVVSIIIGGLGFLPLNISIWKIGETETYWLFILVLFFIHIVVFLLSRLFGSFPWR